MPLYEYQCLNCGGQDQRVAGLDDHTSWCKECGDLMLRQDVDLLEPYSKEKAKPDGGFLSFPLSSSPKAF